MLFCYFLQTEAGWIDLSPGLNFTQEDVEMYRLSYGHTTVSGFKVMTGFTLFSVMGKTQHLHRVASSLSALFKRVSFITSKI